MSLEHSPARRQHAAREITVADDLLLGAGPIAGFLYGEDSAETRRNVYRNPMGLSFFKHGNTLAALKSTLHAEVNEAQEKARQVRQQKKEAQARAIVKPRQRRGTSPN
jgi:hypothetical protein